MIDRARKAEKLLQAFAVKSTTEPTEDWVKLGSLLWEHSYEGGLSDGAAFDRMAKWIDYEAKAAVDARTQTILDYEAVTRKLHLALPNVPGAELVASVKRDNGEVLDLKTIYSVPQKGPAKVSTPSYRKKHDRIFKNTDKTLN